MIIKKKFNYWSMCIKYLKIRNIILLVFIEGIREKKESAILTKRTFSISAFFGRSLVLISPKGLERLFHPWFLARSVYTKYKGSKS